MDILSIGFTHENASEFFETLKANGLERLLEVRLSNTSQLAGFTKQAGLQYFLKESCGAAYEHEPLLAPSEELFRAYCKEGGRWEAIARGYLKLLKARKNRIRALQVKLQEEDGSPMQRSHSQILPPPPRA